MVVAGAIPTHEAFEEVSRIPHVVGEKFCQRTRERVVFKLSCASCNVLRASCINQRLSGGEPVRTARKFREFSGLCDADWMD